MADRIPFPATPDDGDFYTDESGMRWQWSEFKHRWSFKPLSALTTTATYSTTPPSDTSIPWFNPDDGTLSYWSEDDDAWIVASGSGNDGVDGVDGEDLTAVVGITTVSTAAHTLVTANLDKYLRLTYAGEDVRSVTIPVVDVDFAPVAGSIISLRNTSSTTNVTIGIEALGILNFSTGADTIGPKATAQILCVSPDANEWDIL